MKFRICFCISSWTGGGHGIAFSLRVLTQSLGIYYALVTCARDVDCTVANLLF